MTYLYQMIFIYNVFIHLMNGSGPMYMTTSLLLTRKNEKGLIYIL